MYIYMYIETIQYNVQKTNMKWWFIIVYGLLLISPDDIVMHEQQILGAMVFLAHGTHIGIPILIDS